MATSICGGQLYTRTECLGICQDFRNLDYGDAVQEELEAPMPWIGLYIAAASAVCTLAIAADAVLGFRRRKPWLPCKYFSLNAFSLTLLGVSMKLLVDLTNLHLGVDDKIVRINSLVLMSTSLSNFTTSLGSMTNNDIALNLAALSILVLTIIGNVVISAVQMFSFLSFFDTVAEVAGSSAAVLMLLLILCVSGVMVPAAKAQIDLAYRDLHNRISIKNTQRVEWEGFTSVDELRIAVRRYWVMAETGSSQFVIARSATCVASGLICLLTGLVLVEAHVRLPMMYAAKYTTTSNYKWSTKVILVVQSIGVAIGTIAPLMRWFVAARFKSSDIGTKSFKEEMKVESYWTQKLVDWKKSPVSVHIRSHTLRKLVYNAKGLLLNLCIGVQILIVVASKLVLLASSVFVKGLSFFFCFGHINSTSLKKSCCHISEESDYTRGVESMAEPDQSDYSRYVLLLEGEPELPQGTLKNICNEVDKLMKIGRKNQSKNLVKLVKKCVNFNGVREFDTVEVPILYQEPANCWSMPVVTLTSIAISLPNISDRKCNNLLSAVSKALYYVKLIEKSSDKNGDSTTAVRHAADMAWVGVEFSKKWHGKDLSGASVRGSSDKATLQNLSDIAEKIVGDFFSSTDEITVTEKKDSLINNWPVKVIAARSMYRVTQTLLLARKYDVSLTDEELFESLSIMIADIVAACLTNLVSVIISKCHNNAIEEREESVRQAALLFGETEEILEIIQKIDLPVRLDQEKKGNIQEWRAFMELMPR
ncbi:hypothetical protein ABFS83_04G142200 [Erythranthe nasuta]|uniref:DUF4220 domain-containing protein n=1 Tax=Erythranthe guttata TaxID=4155 RepID=A0A022Q6L8_ERYGU|nr:PREDICTED: uncharacterized protein LOC105973329 [Erythranthe guttata]EYU23601.1 hypothetical protein MIMGU_mgv1a001771mg [Erythranthe guttata]|eukprot:XP_012853803.1 PREDICTED: uncharacterized protein LOC105973329 [Erythranthe guttata]